MKFLAPTALLLACALGPVTAHAIPRLQLGILGATYNNTTETSVAGTTTFTLYAFLDRKSKDDDVAALLADTYYIAAAVAPKVSTPAALGSFTFGLTGTTPTSVNVTSDMVYGNPPLESVLGGAGFDPGDLAGHGIYDTYFKEFSFKFDGTNTAKDLDVQTNASLSSLELGGGNNGMYFQTFQVSVQGLLNTHSIHFDLYNSSIVACKNNNCTTGDIDIDDFAPFSHDAQSGQGACIPGTPTCNIPGGGNSVPVPMTALLLGLGLPFLLRRRR